MKRIISLLLSLLLLTAFACAGPRKAASAYPSSAEITPVALGFDVPEVEGFEDFTCLLSAAVLDGESNRNFSPISAYLALSMAAEGANGKTQADLLALLGSPSLDALRTSTGEMTERLTRKTEPGEIRLCNSLWMSDTFPLRKDYKTRLADSYGANAETVRFGTSAAGERISGWIADNTNRLITPDPDAMAFNEMTLAVLLNTVYFRDQWSWRFYESDREPGTFTRADGTKEDVAFFHRLYSDKSVERGDGFLRCWLPFESKGYMVFVLPDEGVALPELLGSPEALKTLLYGGESIRADVDLLLPEFTIRDRFELADVLCSLGIEDAFTDGADFSGMSDVPARLDRVVQETVIDLNELGVEAAAYTIVEVPAAQPWEEEEQTQPPLIEFHLDRPFLFAIMGWGGVPLFVGTVEHPG